MTCEKLPPEYIAILDVGHGNSTVVSTKKGTVVVDVGARSSLYEFLKQVGIKKIDVIALSHADQDHIGAVAGLLACNEFKISHVYLNTDSLKATDAWKDMLHELQAAKDRRQIIGFTPALTQGAPAFLQPCRVPVEICAPCPLLAGLGPGAFTKDNKLITSNTISTVVRISTAKGPAVLLLGDIDELGLTFLKKHGGDIRSPLIVFPHHGGRPGRTSPVRFTREIMNLTKPSTVVFSIGRNAFTNPVPQIVQEIKRMNSRCRVVCTQLSSHCSRTSIETIKAKHLSSTFSEGKEHGITCGGTIIIDLADPRNVSPDARSHLRFIRNKVETPICC